MQHVIGVIKPLNPERFVDIVQTLHMQPQIMWLKTPKQPKENIN